MPIRRDPTRADAPPARLRDTRPTRRALLLVGAVAALALAPAPVAGQTAPVAPDDLRAFEPRPVGPAVTGGRVTDLEGVPDDPSTLYVATASGGLWKTTNGAHSWTPLFDDMPVSTFGDVALAPSNPDVVYAGTGEQNNRQSTSWGDGVYRSDDGGATWRHLGLGGTRHVGMIAVHPDDPDVVWVAALGNLWAPSEERGVFRSTDGGATWERTLYVDSLTGAVDLAVDPSDPDVLYAATYQRLRRAWGFNGGGPGSGIWKSTDGGASWSELTDGLPDGDKGRIGLDVAASSPNVVMATVETDDDATQGTYRSEDGGASWERVNRLNPRPMYYSHIFIDPTTDQRVYVLGTTAYRSEDGGRSFEAIARRPSYDVGVHADHHALWIDRTDPDHIWLAGDAGLHESFDRGEVFRKVNNFPIGQFYAIGVDMRDPYWIYGGMQDNHSWMAPNETRRWIGIVDDDWQQVGFGDGMFWDVDPTDARYAYGSSQNGGYFRLDTRTGDMLDISPEPPPGEPSYRFDWTSPMKVSRHDPSTVYVAGNRLFRSTDRGETWERSPDLSKGVDRDTLRLMGVPGSEIDISPNDGTSSYGEAVALDESPVDPDVFWVGMDDGNLQVTRDGMASWSEVSGNVPGLPPGTYVSRIVASTEGPGVAWATFDAHRDGDFAPYVYRTDDFGETWEARHAGLPTGSVNALAQHPDAPHVLFLGTEHAAWVTTDAGRTWTELPHLPTTAYDDILVHPRDLDLVLGTHGRSIWVLDDTRPLAEWSAGVAAAPAHLFTVAPGTLFHYWKDTSYRGNAEWHGVNPPDGVYVTYRLGEGDGDAVLRITGPDGEVVRELDVPSAPGVHRVSWDLRHGTSAEAERWEAWEHPELPRPTDFRGPFVSPGTYTATLEARGTSVSRPVEVRGDPLMELTDTQYRDRERFLLGALALMDELRATLQELSADRREAAGERAEALAELEERLRRASGMVRSAYSGLNGSGVQQGSLFPPTPVQRDAVERARAILEEARRRL